MGRGTRQPAAAADVRGRLRDRRGSQPAWMPQRRETVEVRSANGKTFLVRLVRRGERYGLDDQLAHDEDEPLVEFYDTESRGGRFGPRGQFVSRYSLGSLAGGDNGPLNLQGDQPAWTVSADAMAAVRVFLDEQRHVR